MANLFLKNAFALGLILAASQGALAIDKQTVTPRPAKPTKMSPSALTTAECKGLGGKVLASNTCATGSQCATTDSDSVIHFACISKL